MNDIPKCEPPDDLAKVDGWHWVQLPFVAVATPIAWMVNPANLEREWRLPSSSAFVSGESKTASTWRYLCPVLAPAEADALRDEAKKWLWETLKQKEEADALRVERDVAQASEHALKMLGAHYEGVSKALRARVAVLERITRMLAGFAEKAATLDWDEDNNGTWAAIVAADARAALSTGSETPAGARGEP